MEKARLRKVLGRFKKSELPSVLHALCVEPGDTRAVSKSQLISSVVDKCVEKGVSRREITQLELQYIVSHPNSTKWKAYTLQQVNAASAAEVDVGVFLKRFQLFLADWCYYELVDTIHASGHWMCLHIVDEGLAPYSCFMLRRPPTPFLLLSATRQKHLSCIMEALSVALECSGWSDAHLSGQKVDSLLEMLIHQYSQGPHSAFRLNQKDANPLLAVHKRKHYDKAPSEGDSSGHKRRRAAEETFGSNPLPRLEKFTFKLEAPIACGSDPIHCQLKLSGSHVLEGVRQCIVKDLISLPVPTHIAGMHSFASNSVTVAVESETDTITHSKNRDTGQTENG